MYLWILWSPFLWPVMAILSFFLTLGMLFSLTLARLAVERLPEIFVIRRTSDHFQNGSLASVSGKVYTSGEAIVSPFANLTCAYYAWRIWHYGRRTVINRATGHRMVPCFVRSTSGDVRLLGYPQLEGFHEKRWKLYQISPESREYLVRIPLERSGVPGFVTSAHFESGDYRKESRDTEIEFLPKSCKVNEQCLEVGAEVSVIGYWSSEKRALQHGPSRGTRGKALWIYKGNKRQAVSTIIGMIAVRLLGALVLGAIVNLAAWYLRNLESLIRLP